MKSNNYSVSKNFFQERSSLIMPLLILLTIVTALMWNSWPAAAQEEQEIRSGKISEKQLISPMIFTVSNTGDSGAGSLRQAITNANANSGADSIVFSIPAADPNCDVTTHVCTISILSNLPPITDTVTLDGYTQPGASVNTQAIGDNAVLKIQIDASAANRGLTIDGPNGGSIIRGLVINHASTAILISSSTQSNNNTIAGNFIGTDPTGMTAVSTGTGIQLEGFGVSGGAPMNNLIGGTTPAARNVIAANTDAILFEVADNNLVQGNYLGINAAGTGPLSETRGVDIDLGNGNLIGGSAAGAGNVIGQFVVAGVGISVANACCTTANNTVSGNFIGTDATGTVSMNNGGVSQGVSTSFATTNTTIVGNLISGAATGIAMDGPGTIQGNKIGTDINGTAALGNSTCGISVFTNADRVGRIGGTNPGDGNIIAFNGTHGVGINSPSQGWAILGNSIFSNGGLGISSGRCDITGVGPTPIDHCDADTGPNNLQNYPDITSTTFTPGMVMVSGTLDSVPSTNFRLEFFSSDTKDATSFGEGRTFLGSTNVVTDGACNAGFGPVSFSIPPGQVFVAATATRLDGSLNPIETSEFSAVVLDTTAAGVSVSGRVATPSGSGISRASVKLTDRHGASRTATTNSFGFFDFEDVTVGQTYIIEVTSPRYRIVNNTRVITLEDEVSGLDFTSASEGKRRSVSFSPSIRGSSSVKTGNRSNPVIVVRE